MVTITTCTIHIQVYSGTSVGDGTAVLLRFSSPADVHRHIKRVHGVFTSSTRTRIFVVDHDRRCQFDVVGIRANVDTPQVIGVSQATSHGAAGVLVSSSVLSVSVSSMSSAVSGGVFNVNAAPVSVSASNTSSVYYAYMCVICISREWCE